MRLLNMPIEDIVVGDRVRADLGDLKQLAESMKTLGLIHPVVMDANNKLIAGLRRLRAAVSLGWTEIPAIQVESSEDLTCAIRAEQDENTCRKDFTPGEGLAMGLKVEESLRGAAEAARRASQFQRKRGDGETPDGGGKLPPPGDQPKTIDRTPRTGKLRDAAAVAAGMSPRSYAKAKELVDAAKNDPTGFQDLADEMEGTGKVDRAHRKLKIRQKTTQVRRILEANPNLTDKQVAEQAGCATKLAGEMRKSLEGTGTIAPRRTKPTFKNEVLKDTLGNVVPDQLRDLFGDPYLTNLGESLDTMMRQARAHERSVNGKGNAWKWLLTSKIMTTLEDVAKSLKELSEHAIQAIPHCVCKKCGGTGGSDDAVCMHCDKAGYLTVWRLAALKQAGEIVD